MLNFFKTFVLLSSLVAASSALAVTESVVERPAGIKNSVWSVGLGGIKHTLKAGDGNELLGNSTQVSLGTGYIEKLWYIDFSFNVLLGPNEPSRGGQLNTDHSGTGFTLWWGYSAQEMDIRSPEGGYGFALGISYADIIGRSIGKNRKESFNPDSSENNDLIDDYVLRTTNLSLLPAIFFCWLEPGREYGNTPDHLVTRVEGYIFTLGMSMPLLASYQVEYDTRISENPDGTTGGPEKVKEDGNLQGYSIIVSLSAILGT